jgi:hypothetical protein
MSQREQWTFTFYASDVLAGAQRQHVHHLMRLQHWQDWSRTLERSQSNEAERRRAQDKVQSHELAARQLATWIACLERLSDWHELELDHEDIAFFGLDQPDDEPDTQTSGVMPAVGQEQRGMP